MIDLHTHSNRSDGTLTPTELVQRAALAGIEILALTDHDSVAGLAAAAEEATRRGVRLVPGVEISASWRAQGIHVLGLWVDPDCRLLKARLEEQTERRRVRMRPVGISGTSAHRSLQTTVRALRRRTLRVARRRQR